MENDVIIYVLELSSGKYYVGRTKNLEKRYKDHSSGKGCSYTKKYPPKKIEKAFYNMNPFDEDRYVIEYMFIYGIDNVRGGVYSMVNLSDGDRYNIKKRIWGASDSCFICGGKHSSFGCRETHDIYGDEVVMCRRCLRKGHNRSECYETYNIFQKKISQKLETSSEEILNLDNEIVIEENEEPGEKICCCTIL